MGKRHRQLEMKKCKKCGDYSFARDVKDDLCLKCIATQKSELLDEQIQDRAHRIPDPKGKNDA